MKNCLQLHTESHGSFSELDRTLFKYVLDNITRDQEGRVCAPALWNAEIESMLAKNEHLARRVLRSTLQKLRKNKNTLKSYDDVIQQQLRDGIIELVDDLPAFLKANKVHSFVPHSAVIRAAAATTKVRVVFMSNLADRRGGGLSHNEISFPGANLNYALLESLTLLRFDKYLISYDLVKAFLQIRLRPEDANRLLFLWVKNPEDENSEVVCYRFLRLAFGLRFSPSILLTVMYYILMYDTRDDSEKLKELKRNLYMLAYVDNIAYSCNNEEDVWFGYKNSIEIFEKFKFPLQKFVTNAIFLQEQCDQDYNVETPVENPFFGIVWDRLEDSFRCKRIQLDSDACTMRGILRTLNGQFDIAGYHLPLLLRAKFFLHSLQLDRNLKWDTNIGEERKAEWNLICAQANRHDDFTISRCVGARNSRFRLCVFTDASKHALGLVVYIWDILTDVRSFILAKSKIVGKELQTKSIPVLELIALAWGIEVVQQHRRLLINALEPVKIDEVLAFSDSSIALSWLRSRVIDHGKIERKAVIINNKVNKIITECETFPVTFNHISGCINPSDYTTRPTSSQILAKSVYFTGPSLVHLKDRTGSFEVGRSLNSVNTVSYASQTKFQSLNIQNLSHLLDSHSSFDECVESFTYLRRCFERWKSISSKQTSNDSTIDSNDSKRMLIYASQRRAFPEVFDFFEGECNRSHPIITQLNIIQDSNGILRVKSKLDTIESEKFVASPILLPKSCNLTESIILDLHKKLKHAQIFKLLSVLRENFYVPSAYSVVKRLIRKCFFCRRLHGHTIKTNTNAYRKFRIAPGKRPFADAMIDFIVDFNVKDGDTTQKCHILVLTCMHTRAVNLIVCPKLDTESFLYALQLHIFNYGIMNNLIADNQPAFYAGVNHIKTILKDIEVQNFFKENHVEELSFLPYPSGASHLGACVESLIAQIKHILHAGIGKKLLTLRSFEFLVAETAHLMNKRPIALKEMLSANEVTNEVPFALTPEIILKGYSVPSMNILPLESKDDLVDQTWSPDGASKLYESFRQLSTVRNNISDLYSECFAMDLEKKATNQPNRYKKQPLSELKINDVVSIKTRLLKPYNYPIGTVVDIEYNSINEINAVSVKKTNGETVRRHPSDIIILLSSPVTERKTSNDISPSSSDISIRRNPDREAKQLCQSRNKELVMQHRV